MSVLACDRYGCENVMCDRLILEGSRYICSACWDELLHQKKSWPATMTGDEVRSAILAFMESRKADVPPHVSVEDAFRRLTE